MSPTVPPASENAYQFEPTQWTVLLLAAKGSEDERSEALATLCQRYWKPLWNYARWAFNLNQPDAEDAVQGFLAKAIQTSLLSLADRERGRFRSFLLSSMKHYCLGVVKKNNAQCRGGGIPALQLSEAGCENSPSVPANVDAAVDLEWAQVTMKEALAKVSADYSDRGLGDRCQIMIRLVVMGDETPTVELANQLGIPIPQVAVERHRFRARLRNAFCSVVSETVSNQQEMEAEAAYLLRLLA